MANIHTYIRSRNFEQVEMELQKDPHVVNSSIDGNWTPLHMVANMGLIDITKLLFKYSPDMDVKDDRNYTPLHIAIRSKNTDTAELLIQNGAYVDACDSFGRTPLHYAVLKCGYDEGVKLLINSKADIHKEDKYGNSPLDFANKYNKKIVHMLTNINLQTPDVTTSNQISPKNALYNLTKLSSSDNAAKNCRKDLDII